MVAFSRRARSKYRKYPSKQNHIAFNLQAAKTKKVSKKSKKNNLGLTTAIL